MADAAGSNALLRLSRYETTLGNRLRTVLHDLLVVQDRRMIVDGFVRDTTVEPIRALLGIGNPPAPSQ